MAMLRYLFAVHLRPAYRLGAYAVPVLTLAGAAAFALGFGEAFLTVAAIVGFAVGAVMLWLATAILNARIAAAMGRILVAFEAAYDGWRRANGIDDPFYHELDREEAAAAAAAKAGPAAG
ncbi:hypothetical protein [Oceanibacterium hippocampi]|uniref:Uncharacterized protein n=1 Tax=Oceanibacterium hippocampi TaxID=745714 RepID=A0A1Y5S801_9PROT|nr:hypothetical protein [Oceanibacterium hippocampi]SLN34546.1 hypothetical protein OCH7691_01339 [Oceanibacterium hippocampi]